jgi:hypothetical protein
LPRPPAGAWANPETTAAKKNKAKTAEWKSRMK